MMPEFTPFQKIPRYFREIIITEKIDGTNSQIFIENGEIHAGSRNRWLTPENDNYGFAAWVQEHRDELMQLGPGRHFGEWWGNGINRNYGLKERRFSLFNTVRWCLHDQEPQPVQTQDPRVQKMQEVLPACCHLVPMLYRGLLDDMYVCDALDLLENEGSRAAPGFMNAEGIVIYHRAANSCFKATLKNDDEPKSQQGKLPWHR